MALIEQTMTEKNLEAHQRNAQHSCGAATPEGKERARAANLRHGYYSQLRDQALVALGEDPAGLAELVEGARQQFHPANPYQAWITERLASLQWRIVRAERMQENKAAAHLRQFEAKRQEAARQMRKQHADVQDFLDSVRRAAARPGFYAPAGCFELCAEVMEQNPSANMGKILELLYRLRQPARFTQPPPQPLADAMSDEEWQDNLNQPGADASPVPNPRIPVAEGEERDPLREELWELSAQELRRTADAWQRAIAAKEAPLSIAARDLLVLGISKEMELMRREERSCFREFWRLENDLRKLQKEAPDERANGRERPSPVQACGSPIYASESKDREAQASGVEGRAWEDLPKDEGASGYVEENTSDPEGAEVTKCPAPRRADLHAAADHDILTKLNRAPSAPSARPPSVLASVFVEDGERLVTPAKAV